MQHGATACLRQGWGQYPDYTMFWKGLCHMTSWRRRGGEWRKAKEQACPRGSLQHKHCLLSRGRGEGRAWGFRAVPWLRPLQHEQKGWGQRQKGAAAYQRSPCHTSRWLWGRSGGGESRNTDGRRGKEGSTMSWKGPCSMSRWSSCIV